MFSVVMPAYNKALTIENSINSVLGQNFSNFELIVVCDPSTDKTTDLVERFSDKRLKVYYRQAAGAGGYAARNFGVKNASFENIVFIDGDDRWESNHLETLKSLTENYSLGQIFTTEWRKERESLLTEQISFLTYVDYENQEKWRVNLTSATMIKKSLFNCLGGFPDGLCEMGGDIELWTRAVFESGCIIKSYSKTLMYNENAENQVSKTAYFDPTVHICSTRQISRTFEGSVYQKKINIRNNRILFFAFIHNFRNRKIHNWKNFNFLKLMKANGLQLKHVIRLPIYLAILSISFIAGR